MTKLAWDVVGERLFEAGVDRGVLYVDEKVVPWNGLVSVVESPTGGSPTPYYVDGVKYLNVASDTEYSASIEAFTYPDEFAECDGTVELADGMFITDQDRKEFNLCYRTMIGNDLEGTAHGYKLHLVYNALAEPSEVTYSTLGNSAEPSSFSWNITATPELVAGHKPTAHVILDSRKIPANRLAFIEDNLYGRSGTYPLPATWLTLDELIYYIENDPPQLEFYDAGAPYDTAMWNMKTSGGPTSVANSTVSVSPFDGVDSGDISEPYTANMDGETPLSQMFYTVDGGTEDSVVYSTIIKPYTEFHDGGTPSSTKTYDLDGGAV